jgi:hypothetical protein
MGLDAHVYCDCYEKGLLRSLLPHPEYFWVDEDGCLIWTNPDCKQVTYLPKGNPAWQACMDEIVSFDRWRSDACEHGDGILVHHRIGNGALVSILREELKREAAQFPLILGRVIYSGTHSGDRLSLDVVPQLELELDPLAKLAGSTPERGLFLRDFHQQLLELIHASHSVGKPICF